MHSEYFLTIAEIAVALAGFAGLIVAISRRQGRPADGGQIDFEFLINVLGGSFLAAGFALLPVTLFGMGIEFEMSLRISAGAYAVGVPVFQLLTVPRTLASFRAASRTVPISYKINIALASSFAFASGLCSVGITSTSVYYPSLLFLLFGAASSFVRVFVSVARGSDV